MDQAAVIREVCERGNERETRTGSCEKIGDGHKRRPSRRVESMTSSAAVDYPQHFLNSGRNLNLPEPTLRCRSEALNWFVSKNLVARGRLARWCEKGARSGYSPCDAFRERVWPDRSSRMCNWPSRNSMSSTPWKPSGTRVQNIR